MLTTSARFVALVDVPGSRAAARHLPIGAGIGRDLERHGPRTLGAGLSQR